MEEDEVVVAADMEVEAEAVDMEEEVLIDAMIDSTDELRRTDLDLVEARTG